jgi:hypothetical protein
MVSFFFVPLWLGIFLGLCKVVPFSKLRSQYNQPGVGWRLLYRTVGHFRWPLVSLQLRVELHPCGRCKAWKIGHVFAYYGCWQWDEFILLIVCVAVNVSAILLVMHADIASSGMLICVYYHPVGSSMVEYRFLGSAAA